MLENFLMNMQSQNSCSLLKHCFVAVFYVNCVLSYFRFLRLYFEVKGKLYLFTSSLFTSGFADVDETFSITYTILVCANYSVS